MQHVLRCWERQSDGTEYKKTLRRPGFRPDPAEGAYSAPANMRRRGWLSLPKNPITPLSAFGPRISYPTPKLVPTPLQMTVRQTTDCCTLRVPVVGRLMNK